MTGLTREQALSHLVEAARNARRPGQSFADAFELVRLRAPGLARLLRQDERRREARGLDPDRAIPNRVGDELGEQVRQRVCGPDGRLDLVRIRTLALANACKPPTPRQSPGSALGSVMCQLRRRRDRGEPVVLP